MDQRKDKLPPRRPRSRVRREKVSPIRKIRNRTIILLALFAYAIIMLHYFSKRFSNKDSKEILNYSTKETLGTDIFYTEEDSFLFPIKSKRLNGFLPEVGWNDVLTNPNTGEEIYNVNIELSIAGSRINLGIKENAGGHIIIAGDSQSFGNGVSDSEVTSNILNERYTDLNFYNLAHPTWSPASTYLFFDPEVGINMEQYVKEENGSFIYLLYPYLTYRDNGYPSTFDLTSGLTTNYKIVQNGLKTTGMFKDTNDFWTNLKKYSSYNNFSSFFENGVMPLKHSFSKKKLLRSSYAHTSLILAVMMNQYLSYYPESNFYVALCDPFNDDPDNMLIEELAYRELEIIDLRDEDVCSSSDEFYYLNNQLNVEGHQKIAELIQQRIIENN